MNCEHNIKSVCAACLCCRECQKKESVNPEQMQDGKRYRIVFENNCRVMTGAFGPEPFVTVSDSGETLDYSFLEGATRIEEIGGES